MTDQIRLRLVMDVTYEPNGETKTRLLEQLKHGAEFLDNEGLLTPDDGEAEVWAVEVAVGDAPPRVVPPATRENCGNCRGQAGCSVWERWRKQGHHAEVVGCDFWEAA